MPTQKPNNEILIAAIQGFEAQKQHIDAQIAELRHMLNGGGSPGSLPGLSQAPASGKRRTMSAEGRARIAEAQRQRWSKKKQSELASQPAQAAAAKPKRKLSAAGRRNIIAATRRRWAKVRAGARKTDRTGTAG